MAASTMSSGVKRPWDNTLSYNGAPKIPNIIIIIIIIIRVALKHNIVKSAVKSSFDIYCKRNYADPIAT